MIVRRTAINFKGPLKLPRYGGGIFLDRDGTMIREKNYLSKIEEVKFLPGVITGLKKLIHCGLPMYIFTNQAGVGHGYFDENTVAQIHHHLGTFLKKNGITIAGAFYCPHHPQAKIKAYRRDCFCRKPNPGLLYRAAYSARLDLAKSYVIGDKLIDIEAGKRVNAKTVLVLTGYGLSESAQITLKNTPNYIATNFHEATGWILKDLQGPHNQ